MTDALKQLHDQSRNKSIPLMKDDGMDFLVSYLQEHEEIRDILECGTAVGYSAMKMALVRWDMRVDTLEVNEEMYREACANIQAQGLEERIHCHCIDAADYETDTIYDLIFVDAAKSQYRRYLEHFYRNTHVGSVFLFDNLNFHGIVDNPTLSDNRSTLQMTRKIRKFRDHLLRDARFETVFYETIGDGIALAKRIAE